MRAERRVVITGLGPAAPTGIGVEAYWEALLAGRSAVRQIEAFDPGGFTAQVGAEVPPFKLADYIPKSYRKSAKVMARDIQFAMVAAYQAVTDAGLVTKCILERGEAEGGVNLAPERFGANIGAGLICADLTELAGALATSRGPDGKFDIHHWGREGMTDLTPLWLLKFLPNMLACHVTIVHDAQAVSNTITCGEASSHLAVGEAYRTIARGAADVSICGGAESKLNPMAVARPALLSRLSGDSNDKPERACRPFSGTGGMVPADGGGLVILEELEHARARGARIYAELVGFGASSNAHSWSEPDPEGKPIALALRNALKDAETKPDQVDLLTTFGCGVPKHDLAECKGFGAVFGETMSTIPTLALKGAVGINGAGAGALDLAATVLALHHNCVPPSPNTEHPAESCNFKFVQRDPIDAPIRHALTLGYALAGGQHAALVIRRYEE